ncbi:hypothetical protein E3U55_09025 [Filobacillus milosensis]|uniref:Uncharacterized protein n=1 Tax=Filobacillus milosensis TaxID=94137 RepID=A0A4Y8IS47_9BACI|nr:hypothetical protein [Filobacillus milosensis]TFB21443.1 hypothetical protein E3U55_09025 [Filobacillus milosensis]
MESQSQSYTKSQVDFINKQLQAAARMAARTEKEILSLFTDDEINLVKVKWSGSQPSNGISFKERLMNQVDAVTPEELLVTRLNVNKKELLQKIMDLTAYQAFTLIRVSSQRRNE